jgi:hypothetical protein
MVKEVRNNVTFYNSVAEDIDIIAYFTHKYGLGNNMWSQIAHSAIACITGGDISVNNLTFKDIRIESPFLYRVISFYSLDTSQPTAPRWLQVPTTDSLHLRINGARFENISVNCPVILHRSLLGSDYNDAVSNLKIINLNINGTRVTEENKDQFFEIEHEKVSNIAFKAE